MARLLLASAAAALVLGCGPAAADKYRNPTAIFAGLDKITGRIIAFEVQVNETVQFGALQLTPKVCYTRPVTERPQTTSFIEVDEITFNNESKRIFNGWMFASSPGLSAIEHPVYDIWLTGCKGATERDLIKGPRTRRRSSTFRLRPPRTRWRGRWGPTAGRRSIRRSARLRNAAASSSSTARRRRVRSCPASR